MKNFIKIFGIIGLVSIFGYFNENLSQIQVFANEPMRAEDSIIIDDGRVAQSGVLADDKGSVFLEFIKDTHVLNALDKQPFIGEILPPQIIEMGWKKPRGRMNEILTFEILADTNDDLVFVDKFSLIRAKEIIRLEKEDPNQFFRMSGFQLFTKILTEDNRGLPALWQYLGETDGWQRVGGKLEPSEEDGVKIFSATLTKTGIFTLFDEDPAPTYSENVDPALIEPVQASPFPSVLPQEPETDPELPEFPDNPDFEAEIGGINEAGQEIVIPAIEGNNFGENTEIPEPIIPLENNYLNQSRLPYRKLKCLNQLSRRFQRQSYRNVYPKPELRLKKNISRF